MVCVSLDKDDDERCAPWPPAISTQPWSTTFSRRCVSVLEGAKMN